MFRSSSSLTERQADGLRRLDHNLSIGYHTQRQLVECYSTGEMAALMREIRSLDGDTMQWTMACLIGMRATSSLAGP
jgi:hypothetical protein